MPLGLTQQEALRKLVLQTKAGKPESNYKEMLEESLIMMNDYRTSGETTMRNYGPRETMDQVWDDVMSGLQEDFGVEMYEESRLQTNIEIFEDIYNHEFTKVQAQVKQVHDGDLLPLRLASQERVGGLLGGLLSA